MTRRKPTFRQRKRATHFVESTPNVPCTRGIQKRGTANLRQAASSRVDARRAQRARQLLKQIEADEQEVRGRQGTNQPPVTRRQAPASPEERAARVETRRQPRMRSVVKRGLKAIAHGANRIRPGGQTWIGRKAS